jgi:hypothetical protein
VDAPMALIIDQSGNDAIVSALPRRIKIACGR